MAEVQYPANPAQQNMIVQGQTGFYPDMYVIKKSTASENYYTRGGRITGWIQISCAIACFMFGVVQLLVGSRIGTVGTGIWSGLLFILPTGILGVCSQKKNTRVIVAYMVMSIISAIVGFFVLCTGLTGVAASLLEPYGNVAQKQVQMAIDILLAINGLLELIVAIFAAYNCYCCIGVCCGRTDPSAGSTMVFHYQNNVPMVMAAPSYGQPVEMGQPMDNVGQQPPPAYQLQANYPVAYPQASTVPGPQPNYNMQAPAPPQYNAVQPPLPEKM